MADKAKVSLPIPVVGAIVGSLCRMRIWKTVQQQSTHQCIRPLEVYDVLELFK